MAAARACSFFSAICAARATSPCAYAFAASIWRRDATTLVALARTAPSLPRSTSEASRGRERARAGARAVVIVAPPTWFQLAVASMSNVLPSLRYVLAVSSTTTRRSSPREERAERELDLVAVHDGVGAGRGDEAHAVGQLETHARVLDRRAGGLLELAMEEARERRAVLHEGEVAVAVLREAAHVALVEVETDAERRDGDAGREARAREVLGLRARAVETVAHEDDATDATARGLVERAEAVLRDRRGCWCRRSASSCAILAASAPRTLPTRASGWMSSLVSE